MSTQTVILVVLLVLFGFVLLAAMVAFLAFLIHTLRDLTKAVNHAVAVFKPVMDGVGVSEVSEQIKHASKIAIEVGKRMDTLAEGFKLLHQAIFAGAPGKTPNLDVEADAGNSAFFTSKDTDMAKRELQRELRKRNIRVGDEAFDPQEENQEGVGGAV